MFASFNPQFLKNKLAIILKIIYKVYQHEQPKNKQAQGEEESVQASPGQRSESSGHYVSERVWNQKEIHFKMKGGKT